VFCFGYSKSKLSVHAYAKLMVISCTSTKLPRSVRPIIQYIILPVEHMERILIGLMNRVVLKCVNNGQVLCHSSPPVFMHFMNIF
jgi:hypothetical protein